MTDQTIKNILGNYVNEKYVVQRVVCVALCLLADVVAEENSEGQKRILELYGTELLDCIDDLTPYQ